MKVGELHGVIERRLLVNFRADPAVVTELLPRRFKPMLVDGAAMVGICLIRLAGVRPRGVPQFLGLRSENAAHRFAVEWDQNGERKCGVYIPRRDTSLWLNTVVGGRIFPGVHHRADFNVRETDREYFVSFKSRFDDTKVSVLGQASEQLPKSSIFKSVSQSSDFFKAGSLGYSPGLRNDSYQGLQLVTDNWQAKAFAVSDVHSTYFEDKAKFPKGSIEFDHALIMRNLTHSWRLG